VLHVRKSERHRLVFVCTGIMPPICQPTTTMAENAITLITMSFIVIIPILIHATKTGLLAGAAYRDTVVALCSMGLNRYHLPIC